MHRQQSLRMSKTSVSRIIKETTDALWNALIANGFMEVRQSEEEWVTIAQQNGILGTV